MKQEKSKQNLKNQLDQGVKKLKEQEKKLQNEEKEIIQQKKVLSAEDYKEKIISLRKKFLNFKKIETHF